MSRITDCLQQLESQGRTALIPYIVAGDPTKALTVPLMHRLVDCGADILEIGVPFSDPMSEGPVIQLGHERALAQGMSLRAAIALVAEFRRHNKSTPVLLMGYANPVMRMGYDTFADAAATAGIDGLLTVDIPPEEVTEVNAQLQRVGIDNIFLVAPTTPDSRIAHITERASGFIYYVSLKGVTGAAHFNIDEVVAKLASIRHCTSLPVAVGFGIKDAASAKAVAAVADGVVVGSALVQCVAEAVTQGADPDAALDAAAALLTKIRHGIDSVAS